MIWLKRRRIVTRCGKTARFTCSHFGYPAATTIAKLQTLSLAQEAQDVKGDRITGT